MKPYIVKQGEYLMKLAHALGFDADKVWEDPKNAGLKAQRDPNLLHPGDILFVPDKVPRASLPLARGGANKYVATIPKTSVRLIFKAEGGGPLADEPYVIHGLGAPRECVTDGEGNIALEMPVHIRECQITFPRQNVMYPVRVGDMDPIDEPSGVRKRLQHLGYRRAPEDDPGDMLGESVEAYDRLAIIAFQSASGLEVTGAMNDATREALLKAHGS